MKIFQIEKRVLKFMGIIALAIISIGYNNKFALSGNNNDCPSGCQYTNSRLTQNVLIDNAMEESVSFSKDKVIEVAFISLKPQMESQLSDYFMQAVPISSEYGARQLASFTVVESLHGKINSQMVELFEWPSIEAKTEFEKDRRIKKIVGMRDNAVSYLQLGYFKVAEDAEITFRQNKIYEFFGAWLIPEKMEILKNYLGKVKAPVETAGGKRLLKLTPLQVKGGDYRPDIAGVVEWPNQKAYFDLVTSKVYRSAVYLRNDATDRVDMLHTKFVIN